MKEVIIIGLGPSGVTAAIYLKRAGFEPLLVGKDFGVLDKNILIENYYGFSGPVSGSDLIQAGIDQAKNLGISIKKETVISLKDNIDHFEVITKDNSYKTRAVLLATGKNREKISIKGFKNYLGKGISLCATCDGYFYRQKNIAIIGSDEYMKSELAYLENITKDITIFTNNKDLGFDTTHKVVKETITKITGDSKARTIHTAKNSYDIDGIFIAIGSPSSYEFSSQLGIIVEDNHISVNENYETNVPGIFASGDIIGGKLQIAKAVYDGVIVAEKIGDYLKNKMA